jgi:hypothetical protein
MTRRIGGRPRRLMVATVVGMGAVVSSGSAHPHDLMRPELNGWFKSLKSKVGEPCCDSGDGEHAEAEWDMAKGGYKVLLKHPHRPDKTGQWFDVPDAAVIYQPNLSGVAMVWWWPSYDSRDGSMTPMFRCFIPGPGG